MAVTMSFKESVNCVSYVYYFFENPPTQHRFERGLHYQINLPP